MKCPVQCKLPSSCPTVVSYLIEGSVGGGEQGEGSRGGEALHHAGRLQRGVQRREVLVLRDQGGHALGGGLGRGGGGGGARLLGGRLGQQVGVGPAEVGAGAAQGGAGHGGAVGEVVVEAAHGPGHVGEARLVRRQREGVEALQQEAGLKGAAEAVLSKYYLPRACGGAAAASASEAGV